MLGIEATDKEEIALLSGPLVRLHIHSSSLVLTHLTTPLHPNEPLGWSPPSKTPFPQTLFFLHYDTTDPARPNRARLATAAPTQTSPRAWIAVDARTGTLSLTTSELHAALFTLRPSSTNPSTVTLHAPVSAGEKLAVHSKTLRARVCAAPVPAAVSTLLVNALPLPPTLCVADDPPTDCTMAAAYVAPRVFPVRIQSRARRWFLASKPGLPLAAATGNDAGWDGFTLEYDSPTRSALLRDSRGLYLRFSPGLDEVVATGDGTGMRGKERFFVETVGEDDRVVIRTRKGYLSARRDGRIVLSKDTVPGNREQFYLRLALPTMMDLSTPRLELKVRAGGARLVEASVAVPAHARVAYEVLRDYEGFSKFIKDASASEVLHRSSETELQVRMVQCHSFLMLTIPMQLVLNVVEQHEERVITMDLERGLGVKQYKGKWEAVEREDGRCLLKCTLLAATAIPAPGFLIDGLMSHATLASMEQLRTECIRRSSLEQPKSPKLARSARRKNTLPAMENSKYGEVPPNGLSV